MKYIYIYIYIYVYVFLIFLKNVGNQAITIDCHCMDEKKYILRHFSKYLLLCSIEDKVA